MGENEQEYDDRLIQVLETACHQDLTANCLSWAYSNRLEIEIDIRPEEDTVSKNMTLPTNKEDTTFSSYNNIPYTYLIVFL